MELTLKGDVEIKMQSFSTGRNKLKDNNQEITYEGEVIATILKEIEYILCSLHYMGSYYADKEREEYEKETTKFIDDNFVCHRLAAIRMILCESFDLSIGEDEMDDIERFCEDIPYWRKPGDSCKEIWVDAITSKYIDMIRNFDFTQFITFESSLDCGNIDHLIKELFEEMGFEVVAYEDIDAVKKEYYNSHWKQYTFELKKAGFLNSFMKWKNEDTVPEDIEKFIEKINLLLEHEVSELGIIICHYAEKGTTTDEVIAATQDKIIHYLFKMSMCSFDCPDNLIINI